MEGAFKAIGIASIVGLVIMLIVGGIWRTEVTYVPGNVAVVGTPEKFEEDLYAHHFLGGLVQGTQPDLKQVLARHVHEGEQLTELTIVTRHTVVNGLLTGITLFIYSPVTVTIRGRVAKIA